MIAAKKARGEAIDKSMAERLGKAEQALFDARKAAYEKLDAETRTAEKPETLTAATTWRDAGSALLARKLTEDSE